MDFSFLRDLILSLPLLCLSILTFLYHDSALPLNFAATACTFFYSSMSLNLKIFSTFSNQSTKSSPYVHTSKIFRYSSQIPKDLSSSSWWYWFCIWRLSLRRPEAPTNVLCISSSIEEDFDPLSPRWDPSPDLLDLLSRASSLSRNITFSAKVSSKLKSQFCNPKGIRCFHHDFHYTLRPTSWHCRKLMNLASRSRVLNWRRCWSQTDQSV